MSRSTSVIGRDRGLQARMLLTMFLLGLLYVVFMGVLFAAGREATVSQRGDIYTLSTTGTATRIGSTGVGEVGDLAFSPIPEPATFGLLSIGLLGVGAATRKKPRGNA